MFVHDGPPRYGAYLLRYWEVRSDRPGQPSTWRFSLEEAGTEERHGYITVKGGQRICLPLVVRNAP